jgi:hypothetical protein
MTPAWRCDARGSHDGERLRTAIYLFEEEVMEKSILPLIRTLEYGSVQTAKVTKRRIANLQVESPAVARDVKETDRLEVCKHKLRPPSLRTQDSENKSLNFTAHFVVCSLHTLILLTGTKH